MTHSLASALAAIALLTVACTTTSKAIGPDEPRTAPPSPPPTVQENVAPTAPAPVDGSLGAPCTVNTNHFCGTKARIAVRVEMRNAPKPKRETPCEMQELTAPTGSTSSEGCVKDERVYLTGDCMECRQVSLWDMTGVVAEMTDSQLLDAQRRIGLPKEPMLRTLDAWRTALAANAAKLPKRKR